MKFYQLFIYFALMSMVSATYAVPFHLVRHQAANENVVNINKANEQTLETIKGIGPARAKAIVSYRTAHGSFRSVKDLLKVKGIGPSRLNLIRARVSL